VADKLKRITSLESREYKRILAEQGPSAAEAYKEELINSELRALGRVPSDERGAPRAASEEKVIDFGSIR
jgi:hypothetical protein